VKKVSFCEFLVLELRAPVYFGVKKGCEKGSCVGPIFATKVWHYWVPGLQSCVVFGYFYG
jgi:hypothetical protein